MRYCLLAGMFLIFLGSARALSPDATREQVITELGKPSSAAAHGGREILIYPKGVRLELEGGRIVSAQGIVLNDGVIAPAESAAIPLGKKEQQTPGLIGKGPKPISAVEDVTVPGLEPELNNPQSAMEKTVAGMMASHEAAQHPPGPKAFDLFGFALEAGLKFLLTVAALKLACKYWGAEVSWSGLLTVAAADVVVRAGMGLAGTLLLGFPSLFYADEAVGGIVMVILLRKLSYNHSLAQAVELTIASKTFSIVTGAFLITVILRLLH